MAAPPPGRPESRKEPQWEYQWRELKDDARWLFAEWIHPNKLADFAGKAVLDAGCGPGHHLRLVAEAGARRAVGVDLNTAALARERLKDLPNVEVFEGDAASFDPGERFDVVYSVGVVHHTPDPEKTARHLIGLLKPGGRLILWVYSREGNALNRLLLEPAKKLLFNHLPRPLLLALAGALTAALYPPVHTLYRLPLRFLPFYEYFANFRRLGFARNRLNVFDKLNAPVTRFIRERELRGWLAGLKDVHVSPYVGVSWRASGTKP